MSKPVSFKQFCKHYGLNPVAVESQKEYEDYKLNLEVLNDAFEADALNVKEGL